MRLFPLSIFGNESRSRALDPITSLYKEVNRVFDEAFREGLPEYPKAWATPSIDVVEGDRELSVVVDLPGVDEKDIDITLNEDLLTIRGERRMEKEESKKNYHLMERSWGSFTRSLRLPFAVDPDQIHASCDNGVLTIKVPKPVEIQQKERRIQIQGKSTGPLKKAASEMADTQKA